MPDIGAYVNFAKYEALTKFHPLFTELISFLHSDILSFYKEELIGESTNYVSVVASISHTSKLDVLKMLIDKTVAAYNRTTESLSSNPKALEAFRLFAYGYVEFHASDPRYKLSELNL